MRSFGGDDLLNGWAGDDAVLGGAGHGEVNASGEHDIHEGEVLWNGSD